MEKAALQGLSLESASRMHRRASSVQTSASANRIPEPVFIVGMNGSGTTMLLDCLNNHSQFYGFPIETKILPLYFRRLEQYGDLTIDENFLRLWNDLRNIVFIRHVNGGSAPPLPADWTTRERTFAGALDGVFGIFAEREGKKRWCEKSPMYALHIKTFAALFPGGRFIHVIRDGRDCAHSFRRRYGFTPSRTMARWRTVVRKAREAGPAIGDRYLEVRYENLTAAPEENMNRVCRFLGVPYEDGVLHLSRERQHEKMVSQTIVENSERWRHSFGARELNTLERIGGRLLHELGYETRFAESEWTPPPLVQRYWRYKDNLRSMARELRRVAAADNWRDRRLFVEKLVGNVRHTTSNRLGDG